MSSRPIHQGVRSTHAVSIALVVLGLLILGCSFLPLAWTKEAAWSMQDSEAYDRVSREYHKLAYQSAAETGRSETEMRAHREALKQQFETLRDRLEFAQQQPQRWSRFLLWAGTSLVVLGLLLLVVKPG